MRVFQPIVLKEDLGGSWSSRRVDDRQRLER
jgi:hypothetical protein